MSFSGLGDADRDLAIVLAALDNGQSPRDIEVLHVDVKEEPGRRDASGTVLQGPAELESVATYLHAELACMANTPGGGAVVVGVADDGARTGATVNPDHLRHRIWELSGGRMTPRVDPHLLEDGTKLLVCRVPQALEPIRVQSRLRWRVGTSCVDIDAGTWAARLGVGGTDWSSEPSDRTANDATPPALNELRQLLAEAGDAESRELSKLSDLDLLRRVPNLLTGGDRLTNTGRLLLTPVPPAIDYVHRQAPGADSTIRIEDEGPLLVQLRRVIDAIGARRRTVHVKADDFSVAQVEALPARSAREAIVNAIVHRDWRADAATRVEHTGDLLRVESPGGLVGTITPDNIITHAPIPRYRALAETVARLRLSERQGIGVDRMFADMVGLGLGPPIIEELAGPRVRVTLAGGEPDGQWLRFLAALEPNSEREDLNVVLALDLLSRQGWITAPGLATVIQDHEQVAATVLRRVLAVRLPAGPVARPIEGRPAAAPAAARPTKAMRTFVAHRSAVALSPGNRGDAALGYARESGRVSSTEAGAILDLSAAPAGEVLKLLAEEGLLRPSSPHRRGRGYHYVPT